MATLDDFYQYVLPEVPGCPEITADVAIRSALIEFCEKSHVIQRNHDPVTILAGITDYELEPPTGQLVVKVMRAWYRTLELDPAAPDSVPKAEVYNTLFTGADKSRADPRVFLQKDERSISVFPIPKETVSNSLTMRVALKPTRVAATFEDVLFEDYAEVIASGAKYRLLSMANKPWTNGPASAANLTVFMSGVNAARSRAIRGNSRAEVKIRLTGV